MKSKIALALGAALLLPSLAMAGAAPTMGAHMHWYAGVGAGPTGFFNKEKTTGGFNGSANYSALGILGTLYGGVDYSLANGLDMAAEIFGDARSAWYKDDHNYTPSYDARMRYTYGLRVLPGYQLSTAATVHLLLGFVRGNLKSTWGSGNRNISNLGGYQVGLGGNYMLSHHVGLRGDLIYSQYQEKTFSMGGFRFKNKPSTFDGVVSVFYAFS